MGSRVARKPEWVTPQVLGSIRKRDNMWRRLKNAVRLNSPLGNLYSQYTKLLKRAKKTVVAAKNLYMQDLFYSVNNTSDFWKAFRKIRGKSSTIPDLRNSVGQFVADAMGKANLLADQFDSVWEGVLGTAPIARTDCSDYRHLTDVHYIRDLLLKINTRKAPGADGIPPILLRNCATVLAPCLSVMYNRSIRDSTFPSRWKHSIITPVPKKGNPHQPAAWRPINVISAIPKTMERHIRELLEPLILPKLSCNQFGFLKGRSTEDALLFTEHVIRGHMAGTLRRKGSSCAISFDIRKAFDAVPFDGLIECLRQDYGVPECLLSWIASYFHDRRQAVKVEGSLSEWRPVKAGVIQGSIIGPLLFAAYFDKVITDKHERSVAVKYADDLLILHPLNNTNDETSVQEIINSTVNKMRSKKLFVNSSKCCWSLFSESTIPYVPTDPFTAEGLVIERTSKLEYLGVITDPKLCWSHNTEQKVNKAKVAVGSLRRLLKNRLPAFQLQRLLTAKVLPIFSYGMVATYPKNKADRLRLERLNRYVARVSLNDYRSPYTELLDRLPAQPFYRTVIHRRIVLGQCYAKHTRYQPPGTLIPYTPHIRRRFHQLALVPVHPTPLQTRDSALESILQSWNRVPADTSDFSTWKLKRFLRNSTYDDQISEITSDMYAAILVL